MKKTLDLQQIKVRSAATAQYNVSNADPTDPAQFRVCNPDPTDACRIRAHCNTDPQDRCY